MDIKDFLWKNMKHKPYTNHKIYKQWNSGDNANLTWVILEALSCHNNYLLTFLFICGTGTVNSKIQHLNVLLTNSKSENWLPMKDILCIVPTCILKHKKIVSFSTYF